MGIGRGWMGDTSWDTSEETVGFSLGVSCSFHKWGYPKRALDGLFPWENPI